MNCPHCSTPMGLAGLIFCGDCWGRLPNDLKAKLIWHHPDVVAKRKSPVKPGSYDALLRTAMGHLTFLSTSRKSA